MHAVMQLGARVDRVSGPGPLRRHILRLPFGVGVALATNCYAERCGELRGTTPRLWVVAPQLSAVLNIKITSRFRRPLVLRQ